MNMTSPLTSSKTTLRSLSTELNGVEIVCDYRGVLYLPKTSTLIVSDLHLEKGAAFARRGMLHPPYDTSQTLDKLKQSLDHYAPQTVISLGDSFHDQLGSELLPDVARGQIKHMQTGRNWVWISGNHDPKPHTSIEGDCCEEITCETLQLRHEPSDHDAIGEISGHLHPAAVITRRGKSVRRACFATDGKRLIMPSFGATTGGLSLKHKAFKGLFDTKKLFAHVLGKEQIYPISWSKMRG